MNMHRMIRRIVCWFFVNHPGVIIVLVISVILADVVYRRRARRVGMIAVMNVIMRHGRAHAPMRE